MPVTHAAVELDGTTLRFAEVAQEDRALLRLGRVVLDFDVRDALDGQRDERAALGQAVADVFAGARPQMLTVALHPAGLTVWSAPLDRDTDAEARRQRLRREAMLLTGADERDLALHVTPLYDDGDAEWQLVMALPAAWGETLRGLGQRLGVDPVRLVPAAQGAARTLGASTGRALVVGLYDAGAELAFVSDGAVRLVGHAPASEPSDAAFTTLSLLSRVGVQNGSGVETLVLFGPGARPEAATAFEGALGVQARPLDPFTALRFQGQPPVGSDAFAPVIGAALG